MVLLVFVSISALCAWLYDQHRFTVRWPADIQLETLGSKVATDASLISKERDFASGEGFARWKYRADADNEALQRICAPTVVSRCTFSRSYAPQEGVITSVSLSRGILTIEEWWS